MKVQLNNITKKYGQTVAVDNFSTELPDGHLICLLGPSGCGKSTILNMLCGIIPVTQGNIFFDDKDVTKLPPDQRNIGMVFQNYALYPHMTVQENIAFPLEVQKVSKKERFAKAEEIAKLVHVDGLLKRYPSELSGGQQQRVAIARALIKNPALLLMDEPLSNLDARLRLEMREEIRRIQQETGVTTVFVTHDQEEAMSISDSIVLMKNGVLVQSGLSQELYNNPNCKFVADFLGNPPVNQLKLNAEQLKIISETVGFNLTDISEKDVTVAIRPESFTDTNSLEAEVVSVSEMGKEQIVNLKLFDNTVRAILNTDKTYVSGNKISIGLKKKGIFVFDEKTGKRLV
ncbi:MAG: ABC transporter ATP-binding protein [Treponema sp.]|nr:ABC transporter ATP-binding protein [Spirochaetia bacterium]MDD7268399.1 ABC transporter ATP-binding protein [Treponema sp.]MDY3130555.1 ABC transporter ATP-binding protein [Treponema sp.]MDY4984878.1 ABC transporter ATP-binding protein [Treponema sp.]